MLRERWNEVQDKLHEALQLEPTPTPCSAYQDFLTLWKDADPNIPILKKAKAEYAKFQ